MKEREENADKMNGKEKNTNPTLLKQLWICMVKFFKL